MEKQYSIIITERVPKTEDELNRVYDEARFIHQPYNEPVHKWNERNVLSTVLSETEFKLVREEILRYWGEDKHSKE